MESKAQLTHFGFCSIIKKIIKLDSTFFYTSNLHISATNEHLKFFSRTFHVRTVALKVTEVQMLQLTPYAGLIVTDRGVSCNTCV